ncbi:hypothetical protein [Aeromicrobium massiliense]|uniref:hypothetical protein n=1 Tax=Aeromicrobium massiliense TaxID=1464554 RepID=UPI0002E2EEDF|nr:hypothetical protein [Aeromicrobium massiliense]
MNGAHRRLVEVLVRRDPGNVLYGAVVTAGVLAAVSAEISHVHRVALGVGASLLAYWLAHVYTATQAMLFDGHRGSLPRRFGSAAGEEAGILVGGVPAVVVYLAGHDLVELSASDAAFCALWFSVGFLFLIGYLGAHRAGIRGWWLLVESIGAASLGVLAVAVKFLLH